MKNIFLAVIFLVQIYSAPLFADNLSDSSYYHILRDLNTFSSFFPRTENSPGEKAALLFIETRLREKGIEYKKYNLSESETVNSWSATIDVRFPGKSGNEIFLIFPLNHPENALPGRDGSANLASALFLAETLQNSEIPQTVHIIFMGAEYGRDSLYPLGTRDYLSNYFPELNSAFFYFNFQGIPDKIKVDYSGTGAIAPLWLLQKSITAINSADITYSVDRGINLINKLTLNDSPYPTDSYLNNDYPAILFEGIYSGYYNTDLKRVSSLQTFMTELVYRGGGLIPSSINWDSHYLFLKIGKTEFFISETNYVIFLLILISLIIIYPFVAGKRFKKYTKTIIHHFWNIPVIFAVMFFQLWISTIILNTILKIQAFSSLWSIVPFHFLALKLSIAILIFLLTLRLFKGIHFSRRGTFYSAAAMIFIIVDLFILISVDIAFSYYILPVFIFVFGFTIFRNKWIKLLFFFLSTLVLAGGTINIFLLNSERVINLILLSPVKGNLMITANLVPLTLMIFRLQFLFHQHNKKRTKLMIAGSDIILALTSITLFIYLVSFNPYAKGRLEPIEIIEETNINTKERKVSFITPSVIGELKYYAQSTETELYIPDSKYTVSLESTENFPIVSLKGSSFLNRSKYSVFINTKEKAAHISAIISGKEELLLFDSNFQTSSPDLRSVEFLIGTNPGLPMTLSFTLPMDYRGELTVKLTFTKHPSMIRIKSQNFAPTHSIIFEKKISIGN
ncbi:MAG: hypothetical protein L3J12_07030 [Spirochaetales bacterium]|nr:hypothetical protein [Spirochaetales bacterium]